MNESHPIQQTQEVPGSALRPGKRENGAAGAQVSYLLQGFGDLGFGTWGPVFTVATAYALVGKLCVQNGAWRAGAIQPGGLRGSPSGAG